MNNWVKKVTSDDYAILMMEISKKKIWLSTNMDVEDKQFVIEAIDKLESWGYVLVRM